MIRKLIQNSIRIIPWPLRSAVKRLPLVAPLQRMLLSKFVEGKEFVHSIDAGPAKGLIYPVVLPDDKGVWTGTYEVDFVSGLVDAVRNGGVCFDVGGWRGYCGGAMAARGAGQVVVFEPLPQNCQRINRLIELNPSLPIRLVNAAVGKSDGNATFTVMDATSMGKLSDSPFQEDISSGESIEVEVISLDSWCAKNNIDPPQVIKFDVEGAEMMALYGAKSIIETAKPTLFVEAHSRDLAEEVVGFLEPMGYDITTLQTGKRPDGKSEPEVCHVVARIKT
jgi:FkbM family methyltransferase